MGWQDRVIMANSTGRSIGIAAVLTLLGATLGFAVRPHNWLLFPSVCVLAPVILCWLTLGRGYRSALVFNLATLGGLLIHFATRPSSTILAGKDATAGLLLCLGFAAFASLSYFAMTPLFSEAWSARTGRSRIIRLALAFIVTVVSLPILGIAALIVMDYTVYRPVRSMLDGASAVPRRMEIAGYRRSLVVTDPVLLGRLATAAKTHTRTRGGEAFDTTGATYESVFDFGSGGTYPVSTYVHADGRGLVLVLPRGPGFESLEIFSDPYYFDIRFYEEPSERLGAMLTFLLDADTGGRLILKEEESQLPR